MAVRRALDEHHRRQIVEVPAPGNVDQIGFFAPHQRLHPLFRVLGIVDLRPAVPGPHVERVEVVMHQAVVVFDALFQEQLGGDARKLPPRRDVPGRRPCREPLDQLDALVHHRLFLLGRHGDGIFVRVAVHADLVTGIDHQFALLGKGLDRMAGNEPRGRDGKTFEQIDQPRYADLAGKQAPRNIAGRVLAAIRAEPACHRIDVDADGTEDFLLAAAGARHRACAPGRFRAG